MAASRKIEHLNEEIRQKLGMLLVREASDPRFQGVTITGVRAAKDLSTAAVTFSCYLEGADTKALTDSLNKAAGFFSHALARTLTTRKTPKLFFAYDRGFDYAQEIELRLKEVRAKDEENNPDRGGDSG